jgi:predicted DNA-binding transcriptional regulator AlpA
MPPAPSTAPPLRLYCARKLCQMLGVSRSTLDDWVKRGLFPSPLRPGGGKRFWSESQVRNFLKAQGVPS